VRNSAFANLVYATFTFVSPGSNMRFYSSAEATDIFFNQLYTGTLSGHKGTCNAFNTTGRYVGSKFDWASKSVSLMVPFNLNQTYLGNSLADNKVNLNSYGEPCPDIYHFFDPVIGIADPATSANKGKQSVAFSFDVNAMIAVISINLGLNFISVTGLQKIDAAVKIRPGTRPPIKNYDKLVAYIDPNSFSPDKTPIYCYDKTQISGLTAAQIAGPDVCFVGSHDEGQNLVNIMYPVMSQMANNPEKTDPYGNLKMDSCQCPDQKYKGFCNYQDVLWGLIFDRGNQTNVGRLDEIAFRVQGEIINNPSTGDITAAALFEPMLGYSANVDYARDTATRKIPATFTAINPANGTPKTYDGTWANGKSYIDLLDEGWKKVSQPRRAIAKM